MARSWSAMAGTVAFRRASSQSFRRAIWPGSTFPPWRRPTPRSSVRGSCLTRPRRTIRRSSSSWPTARTTRWKPTCRPPTPRAANGFERGTYTWNAATSVFAVVTRQDTNGGAGINGLNGVQGFTFTVTGDNAVAAIPPGQCDGPALFALPRCASIGGPGTIVGGWLAETRRSMTVPSILVLLANGDYYFAQDGEADSNGHDGIEKGTWAWNAATGDFVATTSVDTNGQWGLSHPRWIGQSCICRLMDSGWPGQMVPMHSPSIALQ